ncbi:MAG TPA: AgmX/PglI C-terminal domain-containing protein [Kofleriaceae bacterium]
MSVAKFVGYTLLVNVGLVALLDTIQSDDTTARIELETSDLPPDEDSSALQLSMRIAESDVDPAVARATAIEEARFASLCGPISSGFENGHAFNDLVIETTLPGRKVSLGRITSMGDLDRATIRRYMKRNIDKIESCYERELLARPSLEGTIVVQFVILPTGSVKDSHGEGFDATVASCVGDVVGSIAFPRPSDGVMVQVNYPLTFTNG